MEVICINDQFDVTIDDNGNEIEGSFISPKKYELCYVTDIEEYQGVIFYQLEGYPSDEWYGSPHFENITGLQDEINSALKAKNPCIKKFALVELEQIGYIIKNVMPETKIMIISNPFPFNGHWLYDKFNSRC